MTIRSTLVPITLAFIIPGILSSTVVFANDPEMMDEPNTPSVANSGPTTEPICTKISTLQARLDMTHKLEVMRLDRMEKCEQLKNGNAVLTSNPTGSRDLVLQSLILQKLNEPNLNQEDGFYAGYRYGIDAAHAGKLRVSVPLTSSIMGTMPDFARGFETGYQQGFDAYVAMKRLQQLEQLK